MISQRASGDVVILLPRFREETVHEDVAEFAACVQRLAAAGNRNLVVDLSDTKRCDDDVTGALGRVWSLHDKLGGRVVVMRLSRGFRNFFCGVHMDQVIEAYDTEAEAIASFIGR